MLGDLTGAAQRPAGGDAGHAPKGRGSRVKG